MQQLEQNCNLVRTNTPEDQHSREVAKFIVPRHGQLGVVGGFVIVVYAPIVQVVSKILSVATFIQFCQNEFTSSGTLLQE